MISCQEKDPNSKQNLPTYESKKNSSSEIETLKKKTPVTDTLINDELVYEWIEELIKQGKQQTRFQKKKTTVENRFNPSITDTLIVFNSKKDQLKLYNTATSEILKSARIKNENSEINNIKIGMKISQFKNLINEDISNQIEVLTISNLEQTNLFELQFEDQKLTEINYYGYLD
ncbi:hypothetical protein GCM10023115_24980 [Pontixanthobacter gangjinensis]